MAPSSKLLAVLLVALATLTLAAAQTPPPPPPPPATPPSSGNGTCEPLRLRVCSSLLSGLLGGILGGGSSNATSDAQCCSLLGIAGVDAGVCLCTALRANVLGTLNLNVPLALRLVLGLCGTPAPAGFTCPPA